MNYYNNTTSDVQIKYYYYKPKILFAMLVVGYSDQYYYYNKFLLTFHLRSTTTNLGRFGLLLLDSLESHQGKPSSLCNVLSGVSGAKMRRT